MKSHIHACFIVRVFTLWIPLRTYWSWIVQRTSRLNSWWLALSGVGCHSILRYLIHYIGRLSISWQNQMKFIVCFWFFYGNDNNIVRSNKLKEYSWFSPHYIFKRVISPFKANCSTVIVKIFNFLGGCYHTVNFVFTPNQKIQNLQYNITYLEKRIFSINFNVNLINLVKTKMGFLKKNHGKSF